MLFHFGYHLTLAFLFFKKLEVIDDFEHYAVTCFKEFGDKIQSGS